jgi:hypothetical protein
MAQLISEIWEGLRAAGLPEVMLYLADNSASRCHWEDTTLINGVRVALLADQDRQIVRILPVDSCVGIGIASPKGTDPSGYKRVIFNKLTNGEEPADEDAEEELYGPDAPLDITPAPASPPPAAPSPPPPPVAAAPKPDTLASRFGVAMRPPASARFGSNGSYGAR